jgi:hypothetical protein
VSGDSGWISVMGPEHAEGEAPDSSGPYRIDLGGAERSTLVLEVVSTYPAEPHDHEPAAAEPAVAEIEILGGPLDD